MHPDPNTVALQHIQRIRGKTGAIEHRYLRIPGLPRIKLPDLPEDHPEFLMAYARAMTEAPGVIRAKSGTIAAMIEAYLRSREFSALSPDYRRVIKRHAELIREQAEDARAAHLRAEHITADIRPLDPNVAAARLKAWRNICKFGVASNLISSDPSAGIKKPRAPKTNGHPAWSRNEIEDFRAHHEIGTTTRAAFELLFWTGARISDAVVIGPGMIDRGGVLCFTQQKTGDPAFVPWRCPLPTRIDHMADDRAIMLEALKATAGHMTFLATAQGRTRSHKALGTMISEAARKAGIEKSAHGLRKARAIALAEAGSTPHQIGAWTGHTSLSEVEHYTAEHDRRRAVMG